MGVEGETMVTRKTALEPCLATACFMALTLHGAHLPGYLPQVDRLRRMQADVKVGQANER